MSAGRRSSKGTNLDPGFVGQWGYFSRALAMDYPYQFVPAEVRVTDDLPISNADKKKLYQSNAETVFKLSA
ncbi:MAG: hypothetical protein WBQ34_02830 [Candidatus Acidiferrales bacterium]